MTYSPSCLLLHAGLRSRYVGLAHHTIYFGTAWRGTFREIIDQGKVMSDPSFLVSKPTLSDSTLAPDGGQTYYVLFPTPNTRAGIDWEQDASRYREHVLDVLQRRGFAERIETEASVSPLDRERQRLEAGAPFAAAPTFPQPGSFRPPTLDRRIENLFFCGSDTQPGVGVPVVLLSGRLAAAYVTGD